MFFSGFSPSPRPEGLGFRKLALMERQYMSKFGNAQKEMRDESRTMSGLSQVCGRIQIRTKSGLNEEKNGNKPGQT